MKKIAPVVEHQLTKDGIENYSYGRLAGKRN
jgi:hypothetical protein